MGIEDTLLEYHKATGKDWKYHIKYVDTMPDFAIQIREVCINKSYIKFYEQMDNETKESVIYWMIDTNS